MPVTTLNQKTTELLSRLAASPSAISLRSEARAAKLFQGKQATLSFNMMQLKEFILIFQEKNQLRKGNDRCINQEALPKEGNDRCIDEEELLDQILGPSCDTLHKFLKKYCKAKPSLLTLVLSVSLQFILQHSGSVWHTAMMVRQLRETLKFSQQYEKEIVALEKELMEHLLRMRFLLQENEVNFSQVLTVVAAPNAALNAKKAALLVNSMHYISAASIQEGRFSKRAHEKENFRILLAISEIDDVAVDTAFSLDDTPFAIQYPGILPLDKIQTFTANELTLLQLKDIGEHWEYFISQFIKAESNESLVLVMSTILKDLCKKSKKEDDIWETLLDWFDALKGCRQVHGDAKNSYEELYAFLSEHELLPEDAAQPEECYAQALFTSPNIMKRRGNSSRTPKSNTKQKLTEMLVIEEGSNENTPVKLFVDSTSPVKPHENAALLKSFAYDASTDEELNNFDENADDPENKNEEDEEDGPKLASNSGFATTLIEFIEGYYLAETSEQERIVILDNIITLMFDFCEEASFAWMVSAISELKKAEKRLEEDKAENKGRSSVTLNDIYIHIYNVLYAVALSASKMQIQSKVTQLYYREASAALILINKLVASEKLPAHTFTAEKKDAEGKLPVENIVYRSSHKSGLEVFGKELGKQPFLWASPCGEDERYQKESMCMLLLVEQLRKAVNELSILERGLIVYVIRAFIKDDYTSLFYDPMLFLASTYAAAVHGSKVEENDIISLAPSEELQTRAQKLCIPFSEYIKFSFEDEENVGEKELSDQEIVLCDHIYNFLDLLSLQSGEAQIDDFDPETMSVSSCLTGKSKQSGISMHSSYTYRSSASRNSFSSRSSNSSSISQAALSGAASAVWPQLVASERPLDRRTVKFILAKFSDASTVLGPESSVQLLRRAFEWLREQPSIKAQISSSWMSKFRGNKSLDDVPSSDWKGLIKYLGKKGNEEAFKEYCCYLIGLNKQAIVLKTYEIDAVIAGIKSLQFTFSEGGDLWEKTVELIQVRLNAQLEKLEQNKELAMDEVRPFEKMLMNRNSGMFDIVLKIRGKQSSVLARVIDLMEKANSHERRKAIESFR